MDYLDGINTIQSTGSLGFNIIFQLLFFVIIVGYVFYAFLLLLRVRILADTVKTRFNKRATALTFAHLVIALVGSFLALILVLLA